METTATTTLKQVEINIEEKSEENYDRIERKIINFKESKIFWEKEKPQIFKNIRSKSNKQRWKKK